MEIRCKTNDIIKNIFQNKIYLYIFLGSILTAILLPLTTAKVIQPKFQHQMFNNIIGEAKKVGSHIARHQNHDKTSTVFYTALDKLKDDFGIVKIRLFDQQGYIVFSTKKDEIGQLNKHKYYFDIVAKGNTFHKVVQKGTKTLEGEVIYSDVAEIYVPIMKNGIFQGSSEIYYDITSKKKTFKELMGQIHTFFVIFAILFIIVVSVMLYFASIADLRRKIAQEKVEDLNKSLSSKVEEKTQKIKEINKNLELKIKEEIEKNRQKDIQIFQQSKLASMGEMMENIAHQWRQPLSAITSSASSLELQSQLNLLDQASLESGFRNIIKKANYLSKTIEDFRNFAITDKETQDFSLEEIITKTVSIIDINLHQNNIEVIYEFNDSPIIIHGLANELSQVILNILNNASDNFLHKNIEERKVVIKSSKKKKTTLEIYDNGGGIPEQIISKIFDPYFTTKHKSQGTGIGLYMCSEIIQKNFGSILKVENKSFFIDNKEYFGACFIIKFDNLALID